MKVFIEYSYSIIVQYTFADSGQSWSSDCLLQRPREASARAHWRLVGGSFVVHFGISLKWRVLWGSCSGKCSRRFLCWFIVVCGSLWPRHWLEQLLYGHLVWISWLGSSSKAESCRRAGWRWLHWCLGCVRCCSSFHCPGSCFLHWCWLWWSDSLLGSIRCCDLLESIFAWAFLVALFIQLFVSIHSESLRFGWIIASALSLAKSFATLS